MGDKVKSAEGFDDGDTLALVEGFAVGTLVGSSNVGDLDGFSVNSFGWLVNR